MAKNLVIVESPAKAKTIKRYLGSDFQVTPSVGHVMDLPKSKLGVDVEHDFKPEYQSSRARQGDRGDQDRRQEQGEYLSRDRP